MHRFINHPRWGQFLLRFRDGLLTLEDIDMANERCVDENTVLPDDIKYAIFRNRDRDSIKAALFEERCRVLHAERGSCTDAIMIISNQISVGNSSRTYEPFRNCKLLWEGCGEDDVKTPHSFGRMDPVLRLYHGCRIMLPCKKNVRQGQANGTQATIEKVVLKPGETPGVVLLGGAIPITAVCASQVAHIVLKHSNARVQP